MEGHAVQCLTADITKVMIGISGEVRKIEHYVAEKFFRSAPLFSELKR